MLRVRRIFIVSAACPSTVRGLEPGVKPLMLARLTFQRQELSTPRRRSIELAAAVHSVLRTP